MYVYVCIYVCIGDTSVTIEDVDVVSTSLATTFITSSSVGTLVAQRMHVYGTASTIDVTTTTGMSIMIIRDMDFHNAAGSGVSIARTAANIGNKVCTYVCMLACMYVYVCIYVCMYVSMYVYMYVCMLACMYVC